MYKNLGKNNILILFRKNNFNLYYSTKNENNYPTLPAPRNPPEPRGDEEWKYPFEEVKGITKDVFRPFGDNDILGPGAGQECSLKVPEYFTYHRYTFYDFICQIGILKANPPMDMPVDSQNEQDVSDVSAVSDVSDEKKLEKKPQDDCDNFSVIEPDIYIPRYSIPITIYESFLLNSHFNNINHIFLNTMYNSKIPQLLLIRHDDIEPGDGNRKNDNEIIPKRDKNDLKRGTSILEKIFNKIFSRKGSNQDTSQNKDDDSQKCIAIRNQ